MKMNNCKRARVASLTIMCMAMLVPLNSSAQTDGVPPSGKKALGPCMRWSANNPSPDPMEMWAQGECAGMVAGIYFYGQLLPPDRRFCAPQGANQGQALRIVVKYLNDNPAITARDFRDLTAEALHKAWPCS